MPYIYYLPDEQLIEIEEDGTILDGSLHAGIPHTHVCGGSARCSTCRVSVLEGLELCTPRNDAEQALAQRLRLDPQIRLACQTQVCRDGKVTLRRLALDAEDLEIIDDQMAGKSPLGAIGHERPMAILFADLRGFTTFAEALPAYDVIYVLNRYFRHMGRVIERHGGSINSYMGDGLMALFGWDDADYAVERAVHAGVDMLAAMDTFNTYLESLYHQQLRIGIGIHYGDVVVGAVGASSRNKHMTVIGDTVNLASRIEAANKQLGTSLLISTAAFEQVQERISVNRDFCIQLPGKSGEYQLYEVLTIVDGLYEPTSSDRLSRSKTNAQRSRLVQFVHPFVQAWRAIRRFLKL